MPGQAQAVDQPLRLPLVSPPQNRDTTTTKDARLVNCFAEAIPESKGDFWVYKRAGMLKNASFSKTGNGYGTYNWKGDVYAIFGNTVYKNGAALAGTVDTTNGVYRFDSTLGASPLLVFGNGVKAYTCDGTTVTVISDVDFPASFVKGWAYLDATLYVMDSSAKIYGSDLNAPTSWNPLNVITAQIEPDGGVALAKQLVYVIAMKQWSTEVFYDAANSVGSPLSPVQGAKLAYGCLSADSVQSIDDILLWVTNNRSAAPQVARMDALTLKIISTKPVDRLLDELDFTTVFSWQFKDEGHRFYCLTSKAGNLTLAYDLDEGIWSQWTDSNGNYFPIVSSTYNATLQHFWQHESNGNMYLADREYTNDDGTKIVVDIYTPNFDGALRRKKLLNSMEIIADQTPGSILKVRKSDDDYQTWSNFREIDLSKKRPRITKCGSFYRRAHNFRHESNTSMRLMAVDLQMDTGTL